MTDFPRPADDLDADVTAVEDAAAEATSGTVNITNVALTEEATDATTGLINALPGVITETKAGYKSTEFWLAIITAVLVQVDVISLPGKYEGLVAGALAVAYTLSRGFAKQGIPYVEEPKRLDTK